MAPVPVGESQIGDSYVYASGSSPPHLLQNYEIAKALVLQAETESAIDFHSSNRRTSPHFSLVLYGALPRGEAAPV